MTRLVNALDIWYDASPPPSDIDSPSVVQEEMHTYDQKQVETVSASPHTFWQIMIHSLSTRSMKKFGADFITELYFPFFLGLGSLGLLLLR